MHLSENIDERKIMLKDKMKIFDISPTLSAKIAVYPGDVPFKRDVMMDMRTGDHLTLSSITTSVHVGAHADAPNHYHREGVGIDERSLEYYLGPCQVIEVKIARTARIQVADLKGELIRTQRVLFKTRSFPNQEKWCTDYNSLSPELIDYLATRGVKLIGIDTPSIDPDDSKALESHKTIHKHDLAILEGLLLDAITPGEYFLAALPLKIQGGDASPVRAVLLRE